MPLLNKLTSNLKNWNKPIVSWFGRAAILKMNALPRPLYILQTIPIQVPLAFFNTYKNICSRFLWVVRKPRISFKQLSQPKRLGGIGLPDLLNYYTAVHLSRIVDWNVHSSYKDWVPLDLLQRLGPPGSIYHHPYLESLPWTTPLHIPSKTCLHPLIGLTLHCSCRICSQTTLSSIPGPLTSVKINPDFPPGMHCHFFTNRWSQNQIRAHQFFHQGKLLTASHLSTQLKKHLSPLDILTACTLSKIIRQKLIMLKTNYSLLNALHSENTPKLSYICHTHPLIFADLQSNDSTACKHWEGSLPLTFNRELGTIFSKYP